MVSWSHERPFDTFASLTGFYFDFSQRVQVDYEQRYGKDSGGKGHPLIVCSKPLRVATNGQSSVDQVLLRGDSHGSDAADVTCLWMRMRMRSAFTTASIGVSVARSCAGRTTATFQNHQSGGTWNVRRHTNFHDSLEIPHGSH